MVARARGKPEFFGTEQNRALKAALVDHLATLPKDEQTQAAVGRLLDVTQQTAGRYMSTTKGDVGFGYLTATRIARLAGFRGVDDFFEAKGVGPADAGPDDLWPVRNLAARQALRSGISESAIERVKKRYAESQYRAGKAPRWWEERFRIEHEDMIAEKLEADTDEAAVKIRKGREGREKKPEPPADAAVSAKHQGSKIA